MQPAPYDDTTAVLAYLNSIAEDGEDGLVLLEPFLDHAKQQQATLAGAQVPGEADALLIPLSDEQRDTLAREFSDLIEEYRIMIAPRVEREQEILDSYAMIPNPDHAGANATSEQLVSEMTMSFVDAAFARIATTIMGIKPLMRVDPIETPGFEGEGAMDFARETERFINDYALYGPPDFVHLLPKALLRAAKVGTAVLKAEWRTVPKRRRFYTVDNRAPQDIKEREGQAKFTLIDNDKVYVWPPTCLNWQDATFVGYDCAYTPEEWRQAVRQYNIPPEIVSQVVANPREQDSEAEAALRRDGMNASEMYRRKELEPIVLTELWCSMAIPGEAEPRKFQVILHRPNRQLLYIGENPYFSEKTPIFPLRYKWSDSSAWGTGVGHEVVWQQAFDSATWNLEGDNLMAGAFYVVRRKPGSVYNTQGTDDIRPGSEVLVDDPDDLTTLKMGGEAPEIQSSRATNYQRARTGSGLSSVMTGQGDPVMKSGAGTGSVLALIEQGDKKLRMVDSNLRTDLSDVYTFLLELVSQYAPDGLYFRYAPENAAEKLRMLKWVPPRGEIGTMFRLRCQAPSVTSSDEQRKQSLMLLGNLANQHVQIIDQMETEQLQQENPAAIPRWKRSVIDYLTEIHRQTIELHEIPRVPELVPIPPEPLPEDEVINGLQEQLQQAQQQLEQMQQQMADLQARQQAPMGQGGDMGMMGQGGMMGGGQMGPEMMAQQQGDPNAGMVA